MAFSQRNTTCALALACLAVSGCEAEERAIDIQNFSSSSCLRDATVYDSSCAVSSREEGTLELEIRGIRSICLENDLLRELPWHAVAHEQAAGRVTVSVDWPSDKTPACGSCTYNFKFELGPYAWPDKADILFEIHDCPNCGVTDSRSISLDTRDGELIVAACGDDA